jgi:hypothetical protein
MATARGASKREKEVGRDRVTVSLLPFFSSRSKVSSC